MIHILAIIFAGIAVGYLLRKRPWTVHIGSGLTIVIMLLLFFLGVSVGNNEQVIRNFGNIGLDAFLLTVGATIGSVVCAWGVYRLFFKHRK